MKDELNEPRVNEGCVAPNTNTENETKEALKMIFLFVPKIYYKYACSFKKYNHF